MESASRELSKAGHNAGVFQIKSRSFVVGDDPNRSLCLSYMERNNQALNDGHFYCIEIVEIAGRMLEKLWRIIVKRDPTRTEIPGSCPANVPGEFSAEIRPTEFLLSLGIRFQK